LNSKINNRAGDMVPVIEYLPSKHEAKFKPQFYQKKKKTDLITEPEEIS
jgi:hypothetical protein